MTVYATDGDGADSETLTWNFTVTDVDRAPTVPTGFNLSAATLKYGETVTASDADGSEDADGDEVGYQYTWTLNGAEETVNEDGAWPGYDIKRADVVAVTATAKSTPAYGTTTLYSDATAATSITVDNTVPTLVSFADSADNALKVAEYTDEAVNAEFSLSTASTEAQDGYAAGAVDVDGDSISFAFADGGASLTVKDGDDNEIATVAIDGTTLTITPVQYAVTADTAYSFSIIAIDEAEGESEEAEVYFTIPLTNTAPEVTVSNIFASPAKAGTAETKEFAAVLGKSDWENANQAGTVVEKNVTDNDSILSGEVTISDYARKDDGSGYLTVTYTLAEDAAQKVGKVATVTFQLQDDGAGADAAATSEVYTFTITVGGTPWWPEIDLGCTEHEYHQVVITPAESASVTLVVTGSAVAAADYYNAGYAGMKDGESFTWEAYAFDSKDGVAEDACADGEAQVEAYSAPEAPEVTLALGDEDGTVKATVSAPLAASYTLSLLDADGAVVKTLSASFAPGEEGISSTADVVFAVDAGTYQAKATATNPEGTSEEGVSEEVEVAEAEPDYKWSDGAYLPSEPFVYVPANATQWTVTFSWPSFVGADSYSLVLDYADGSGSETISVKGLSYSKTFKLASDALDISWYVQPVGTGIADGYAYASDSFSYQLLKNSSTPVVTGMAFNASGDLELTFSQDASDSVSKIEFEVFGVSENDWVLHFLQNAAKIPEFSGDGLTATVDGFSGLTAGNTYYVLYRLWSNNKATTQFRLWSVTK